jgi:hypothetical protein
MEWKVLYVVAKERLRRKAARETREKKFWPGVAK